MRYLKFHRTLFAALLVCTLALCASVLLQPPREPLLEKAMELEAGQFICEDGSIWQISDKPNYSKYAYVQRIGGIDPETIQHEFGNRVKEPVSAAEYAQRVCRYGDVWLTNSGEVWTRTSTGYLVPHDELGDFVTLVPFFQLSEEIADSSVNAPVTMRKNSLTFDVSLESEDEDSEYYYTLAIMLDDGWRVVDKGSGNYRKETVRTGWQDYQFENGNITQVPVMEDKHFCTVSLDRFGNLTTVAGITEVPGSYRLKVYAHKDEKVVQLAEYNMTTEIKGKTLYINETAAG